MVKHVVMWRLRDPSPAGKEAAKTILENMEGKIPGMKSLEVGLNFNRSDAAYDIVLLTTHDAPSDLDIYQSHPEHLKIKEYMSREAYGRVVIDYADLRG